MLELTLLKHSNIQIMNNLIKQTMKILMRNKTNKEIYSCQIILHYQNNQKQEDSGKKQKTVLPWTHVAPKQ